MSIFSLVYTSISSQKLSDLQLKELLKKSRNNNENRAITGMLLYMDPYFIQVLEGEEKVISEAFDTIKIDPRHQKVSIIYKKPTSERCFANWTMGFNKVRKEDIAGLEGFNDYLQRPTPELFVKAPNQVTELLNKFRREILF